MRNFFTAKDVASLWKCSERRVQRLCRQGRISGAEKVGGVWRIPEDVRRPQDLRGKTDAAPLPDLSLLTEEKLYGTNTPVRIAEQIDDPFRREEGCVITHHEIFPGILFAFHDIHADHLDYEDVRVQFPKDMLSIQHCREGRFEGEYANGECFYLGQGDLSVNLPAYSPSQNTFPLSHYHGCNIAILPGPAEESVRELERRLGPTGIDFQKVTDLLQTDNHLAIFRSDPSIQHILSEAYLSRGDAKESYLRLKVLELLMYLCSAAPPSSTQRTYYDHNQVRTVKEIRAYLTAHLDERCTLQELSLRFHMPLTSMKSCFKGVFGMSINAYLREYRLQAAAELLRASSLPIGDIAMRVGYESHSKFAEAFQKKFGQTPARYRKTLCLPGAIRDRFE